MVKYYINRGSEQAKELYATYKIYVTGNKGLNDKPVQKEEFTESFADRNGQKAYERVAKVYEPQKVSINFVAVGDLLTVKASVKNFITYLQTVTPSYTGSLYGTSKFNLWNDLWNETKTLRYLGFDDGAKLTPQTVKDMNNPNTFVHGYFFTLNFIIDEPKL